MSSSTIASTPGSTARHRSSEPVLTLFSGISLGSVVPVPAVAGRSGLVLALSSGLVASMGLPASGAATEEQHTAVTASLPVVAPDAALASESVTASASATVSFEHAAFHPASSTVQARPVSASTRDITTISRSLAGNAYRADLRAQSARRAASAAHAAAVARRTVHTTRTSTSSSTRTATTHATVHSSSVSGRGASVVAIASRYLGIPYVYGGSSPRGFDCSGLTMYVYAQLGVSLPRTAAAQYGATTRIARSQAVPGDLIFFFTGGSVTHVAIYLGGNMMLAAPHTGDVVKKQSIYSANIAFGRV